MESLPEVPTTYVLCTEDRLVNPEWSRRRATLHGLPIVQMPGSHSPFLSRAQELSDVLTAEPPN